MKWFVEWRGRKRSIVEKGGGCEAADPWNFSPLPYSENMTHLE
jgi:hypothetical protein